MKLFKISLFMTLFVFLTGVLYAAEQAGSNMMQGDGMMGGWLMTVACAVLGLLLFIVLILGILALIKKPLIKSEVPAVQGCTAIS